MSANDDLLLFARAAEFAAHKHREQRRKNGDIPYINHPLGAARILAEEGGVRDGVALAAAVLHDTVEDTDTTLEELRAEFGEPVASAVSEVTDDKSLPKHVRKQRQVAHSAQLSAEAKLIKLADKIYNLRDLGAAPPPSWGVARIQGYFCWAFHVVETIWSVNKGLQKGLREVFSGHLVYDGQEYQKLPESAQARRDVLESYYLQMESAGD